MHAFEEFAIRQACADLVARYAYLNDERRYDDLADLFTDDAVLYRPSAPDQAVAGRPAILAAFRNRPASAATFHVTSDVVIDVAGAALAHGRSRILMLGGTRAPDGAALPVDVRPPVPGVFHDVFTLTGQGWKFAERRGRFWI